MSGAGGGTTIKHASQLVHNCPVQSVLSLFQYVIRDSSNHRQQFRKSMCFVLGDFKLDAIEGI